MGRRGLGSARAAFAALLVTVAPTALAQARRILGPGSGTYTVRDYTLTLRDRDRRVWEFSIYLPPGEGGKRPRHLVINEREIVRE